MHGRRSREIVDLGLNALCNLDHRGAKGAEENTGDGAGILVQVPDGLFRAVVDFDLPPAGEYATGIAFLPADAEAAADAATAVEKIVANEGLTLVGWRELPVDPDRADLGSMARAVMPRFRQLFVAGVSSSGEPLRGVDLDRRAYVLRKRIAHGIQNVGEIESVGNAAFSGVSMAVYFPSLSSRTFVYKGMLTTPQLQDFFGDLNDERLESAIAMVHSRFSTNSFPSWPLAHPYRYVAHNGEINTVLGNRNWMRAREELIETPALVGDLERIYPICTPGASDTASFDDALEMLHLGGYPLPHAVLMMIPEAWENHEQMDDGRRAFYRYHASLMEPWDGPASIAFTDGTVIGAVLDRNGLRPSRYWVTADDRVIMASEAGVVDVPPDKVTLKGRLQPGRMFLVDTIKGRIIPDAEIKAELAAARPYADWLATHTVSLPDLASGPTTRVDDEPLLTRQQTFGYTLEELKVLLTPMGRDGGEAIGSMGTDTPLAVLSSRSRLLYDYFTQLFAQVTNPPLDAMREELVTSLRSRVGPAREHLRPSA